MSGKGEEYQCGLCGELYLKGQSDEDAEAEAERNLAPGTLDEAVIVCDSCYKVLMMWAAENAPELLASGFSVDSL